MPIAAYPSFTAGSRLVATSGLLEMILLELPSEDILFAQWINRRFRLTIIASRSLQLRVFLITQSTTSLSKDIILNPILTKERSIQRISIYFDDTARCLAYCERENRERVYCSLAAIGKDETTNRAGCRRGRA